MVLCIYCTVFFSFCLFLDNLDDVLVLHDVCEPHPLWAVLGTGSLGDTKKKISFIYEEDKSKMELKNQVSHQ